MFYNFSRFVSFIDGDREKLCVLRREINLGVYAAKLARVKRTEGPLMVLGT